ncbi:hypothetical protein LXL04_029029 [Taraxacum kok-saghyz]
MDSSKEISTMENVTCSLTDGDLNEIRDFFKIGPSPQLVLPTSSQTIKTPQEGFVGIYHQFLKAGLRFPVFDFLKTVLSHYNLHIAQLAPNSFRKIICFVMLSRALGVSPSLTVFRHFYVTLNAGDWVSFTRRQGIDDICDGIPSSIKKWKPEFIFVDAKEFSPDMEFGDHKNRVVDHPPELTTAQHLLVDQMVANPVKWSDPDELMLGMAGLSTFWTKLGKQPRRKFTGTTEVLEGPISDFLGPSVLDTALEEESSMDSANQAEGDRECTSDVGKGSRRVLKSDRVAGRPPSHPSRPIKEVFVVKKRSATTPVGGPSSPDSEKGVSVAGETKDISQSKQRRLVRGGRHSGKGSSPADSRPVPPAFSAPVSKPDVSQSSLLECPVSASADLEEVPFISDSLPVDPIVFPPSQLPSTASLTRTVDLPFPKTMDSSPVIEVTTAPLPISKSVGVKAADSAFRRALRGAGFGFGGFTSAVVSSPELIVAAEKQTEPLSVAPDADHISVELPGAVLSIPSVSSSPEAVADTIAPDSPSSAKVSVAGSSPSIPTLVSLAATLPAFQRPYVVSPVGRVPGLGDMSKEEGLDRARSLLLEGMHWVNGVMLRQRTRASVLAAQQVECDRVKKSMDDARADYMTIVVGKLKLVRDLQQMELRNQELVMEIDSMKEKQKELLDVRHSIETQLEDVYRHREVDLKKLEEVGQQLESLKLLFSDKVTGLEISCNQKDVILIRQGHEIEEQKAQLLTLEGQVKTLTSECSAAKQAELFHQQMSEQHSGDLSWLLKHGIASSVRAILNSEEFGSLNAACQTTAIQVGLTQACLEMRAKYPVLEKEPLLHSYPDSQEELMDRFTQMTGHEYQLLGMLRDRSVGVEYLKKYLDDGGGDEVNITAGGGVGIGDLGSVRADSAGWAHLNMDGGADSKVSESRADDDSKPLGKTDNAELSGASHKVDSADLASSSAIGANVDQLEDMGDSKIGEEGKGSVVDGKNGDLGEAGDADGAGPKSGLFKLRLRPNCIGEGYSQPCVYARLCCDIIACLNAELLRLSSSVSRLYRKSVSFVSGVWFFVLIVRIVNSTGIIASEPYTRLNGVS